MKREAAFALIDAERGAQQAKWGGSHLWGRGDCSSSDLPAIVKAAVLAEECGEVTRAVLEKDAIATRDELVQVAAVAVAWLESFGDVA
jgi:hypothetical protein